MSARTASILLVEDNPGDARLVREALRENGGPPGYEVQQAERLEQALDHLRAGIFDLAIVDLNLPDSRGLDTLQRLRDEAPDVPALVLTGVRDAALGMEAIRGGATDCFVKGELGLRALARAVRYTLERSSLERAQRRALARVDRLLRMFSAGAEKLLRATDERVLLADLCDLLVDTGGYRVAWVEYAREAGSGCATEVMESAGIAPASLREGRLAGGNGESWSGLPAEAIRSGERSLVTVASEARADAMPREGFLADLDSILALPLGAAGDPPFGALAVGSSARDGFGEEELRVLGELAEDLAFAIVALRRRG